MVFAAARYPGSGQKDQSVDMVALEHLQVGDLPSRPVQCRESDTPNSRRSASGLHRGREEPEERVGDIGDDEPDRIGASKARTARVRTGSIVDRPYRRLYTAAVFSGRCSDPFRKHETVGTETAATLATFFHPRRPRHGCFVCSRTSVPISPQVLLKRFTKLSASGISVNDRFEAPQGGRPIAGINQSPFGPASE